MNISRVKGTAWLVHDDDNAILIDTGMQRDAKTILKKIKKLGVTLNLIFLTHTHYDHTGSAEQIRCATGAKVAVSAHEADFLRAGYTLIPKGTGLLSKFIGKAGHTVDSQHREHYPPVTQDIIEINDKQTLSEYGFDAQVVPLGAHSIGSIGLHIGDHFFAGDTIFGIGGAMYPLFADYAQDLPAAWKTMLDSDAKYIYPGHGRKLNLSELKKFYNKKKPM